MIITTDGHKCKRGEKVWEVSTCHMGNDIYENRPVRSTVHGGYDDVANPSLCWKDYDLCKEYCDNLNKRRTFLRENYDLHHYDREI